MTTAMMGPSSIFTIELPDGRVYTGAAVITSISVETPALEVTALGDSKKSSISGLITWEVELRGTGSLTTIQNLEGAMEAKRGADWMCPYCGRTWPRSQHKCWDGVNGCGANRPAMWWVKHDD